jgi:hypothetical protein
LQLLVKLGQLMGNVLGGPVIAEGSAQIPPLLQARGKLLPGLLIPRKSFKQLLALFRIESATDQRINLAIEIGGFVHGVLFR